MYESVPVTDSSFVTEIGYDSQNQTITVVAGGKRYTFPNMDRETYVLFCNAESKGKFFHDLRRKA